MQGQIKMKCTAEQLRLLGIFELINQHTELATTAGGFCSLAGSLGRLNIGLIARFLAEDCSGTKCLITWIPIVPWLVYGYLN